MKEVLGPVTYIVETDDGHRWKRHADQIKSWIESVSPGVPSSAESAEVLPSVPAVLNCCQRVWRITHQSPLSRMLNLLNRWKNLRRPTLLTKKSHPWRFPLRHLPCLNQTLMRLDIIILHEIVDHLTDSSDVVGNLDMYMYVPVSYINYLIFCGFLFKEECGVVNVVVPCILAGYAGPGAETYCSCDMRQSVSQSVEFCTHSWLLDKLV